MGEFPVEAASHHACLKGQLDDPFAAWAEHHDDAQENDIGRDERDQQRHESA